MSGVDSDLEVLVRVSNSCLLFIELFICRVKYPTELELFHRKPLHFGSRCDFPSSL